MLSELNDFIDELRRLRAGVRASKTKTISKKRVLTTAQKLSSSWLSDLAPRIKATSQIPGETIDRYTNLFRRLLKISSPSNPKKSHEDVLRGILKDFRKELILPLHEGTGQPASLALLSSLFASLSPEEDEYLKEAIACAQRRYFRAAAVMGWSAGIDRIHRKIEQIGFSTFNSVSFSMTAQQKGRFKKFNQTQSVSSMSELREVFDNIILWIIEGMGLIDSNQHTRLRGCFDLRCQSAHPGEAPVTEYNLLSFFSDLKEIVLENAKFQLT